MIRWTVVAWTDEQLKSLEKYKSEENSKFDIEILDVGETLEIAPGLSDALKGSVFVPGEVISDPWLVYMGYLKSAESYGAKILTNSTVTTVEKLNNKWSVKVGDETFLSRKIINCGGLWGDNVEKLRTKDPAFIIHVSLSKHVSA